MNATLQVEMTTAQVARQLGLSQGTVLTFIKEGSLPATKGHHAMWYMRSGDVAAFALARASGGKAFLPLAAGRHVPCTVCSEPGCGYLDTRRVCERCGASDVAVTVIRQRGRTRCWSCMDSDSA